MAVSFTLDRRRRLPTIVLLFGIALVMFGWAGGFIESSDMGSAPYRIFAAVGFIVMVAMAFSEVVGLRNKEIHLSPEGISAPQGLGRRVMTVRWEDVAAVEVFRVPYGEVLSLRPVNGKTMRIGLREVDDPDGLVEAVRRHTNPASS